MKNINNINDRKILDFEDALDGLGGETELYQDLINSFFGEDGFSCTKLRELVNSGKNEEAFHYAHLHKGVAGMLGAQQFFDALDNFDKIIRNAIPGDIGEAIENACILYEKTAQAIKEAALSLQ